MFVFPQSHVEILIPSGICSWDLWEVPGHEGGAFMNGISALIKETLENKFVPSTLQGHSKNLAN